MWRDWTWQEVRDPDTNISFIKNNKHATHREEQRETKRYKKQRAERRWRCINVPLLSWRFLWSCQGWTWCHPSASCCSSAADSLCSEGALSVWPWCSGIGSVAHVTCSHQIHTHKSSQRMKFIAKIQKQNVTVILERAASMERKSRVQFQRKRSERRPSGVILIFVLLQKYNLIYVMWCLTLTFYSILCKQWR